ncbi:MAG: hypothetical protein Q8807_03085 ['Waltheria sp.' little leaf phytoplasma]|nr:hypothetical protein ['Waltheria sp.' little leaf phytoplasma]
MKKKKKKEIKYIMFACSKTNDKFTDTELYTFPRVNKKAGLKLVAEFPTLTHHCREAKVVLNQPNEYIWMWSKVEVILGQKIYIYYSHIIIYLYSVREKNMEKG